MDIYNNLSTMQNTANVLAGYLQDTDGNAEYTDMENESEITEPEMSEAFSMPAFF